MDSYLDKVLVYGLVKFTLGLGHPRLKHYLIAGQHNAVAKVQGGL